MVMGIVTALHRQSAKYGTKTLMGNDSGKVVALSVVQVSEVTSSIAMEKEGFKHCI